MELDWKTAPPWLWARFRSKMDSEIVKLVVSVTIAPPSVSAPTGVALCALDEQTTESCQGCCNEDRLAEWLGGQQGPTGRVVGEGGIVDRQLGAEGVDAAASRGGSVLDHARGVD